MKNTGIHTVIAILFFGIGVVMSFIPVALFSETGSVLGVVFFALPTLYALFKLYGKNGLLAFVLLGVTSLIIETVAIYTGFPYSFFEYTTPMGYQILGKTPWTVFIAWSPLVVGSFLFAKKLRLQKYQQWLVYIVLLVATDVVLDPGAVARGLWKYTEGGFWFGVPLQNFIGWIVSGTIVYGLLTLFLKKTKSENSLFYKIGVFPLFGSLFLWTGVNAGYGLWLPAVTGVLLGSFLVVLIAHTLKNKSTQQPLVPIIKIK